jgi:multiple sugar transport system permease protein
MRAADRRRIRRRRSTALFSYRGLQGLINSLIIASAATVLSTVLGTMMAYSLARFNTGGQHLAF